MSETTSEFPKMNCPCCGTPAVPGIWAAPEDFMGTTEPEPRWLWYDDQEATCPGCGCLVGIHVTDDYAEDRVATTRILKACGS